VYSQLLLSLGAPDSVRCARLGSSQLATLGNSSAAYDYNSPDCPVSQRSTAPTVGRAIRARHMGAPTVGRGAPDCPVCTGQCPVCQLPQFCNGQMCHFRKGIRTGHRTMNSGCPVVHRTVRCATRQKARIAFQECLQRFLAALGL
jgi:hypothetical protein